MKNGSEYSTKELIDQIKPKINYEDDVALKVLDAVLSHLDGRANKISGLQRDPLDDKFQNIISYLKSK